MSVQTHCNPPLDLFGNSTLQDLLNRWNEATAPYVLRGDHEHHRMQQIARAINNRMRRLGYREDLHWHELSSGFRVVKGGMR